MSDYDSPWKEAMDLFFELFLAFFFPKIHATIDWTRDYESLEQELRKLSPEGESGKRYVDKLVKVYTKTGDEAFIHVESQNFKEDDFPRRLHTYNYRATDRFNHEVVTLAVLGDEDPKWKPDLYKFEQWGCVKTFEFPLVKLLRWRGRKKALETHQNPFALLTLAHLEAMGTQQDDVARGKVKVRLIKQLYERALDSEDMRHWYRFLDWFLNLPPKLEAQVWEEIARYTKERKVPYVSNFERIAMENALEKVKGMSPEELEQGLQKVREEGIEERIKEAKRAVLLPALELGLELKFGAAGLRLFKTLGATWDLEVLQAVFDALKTATSVKELKKLIAENGHAS